VRQRFSSTAVAIGLAGTIVFGVLAVLVLAATGSRREVSDARNTVAVAELTAASLDTTFALQTERGLAAVVATRFFSSLRPEYEAATEATDQSLAELRAAWSQYRDQIPELTSPAISDVLASSTSLAEFRVATLEPSNESTYPLYTELVEQANGATDELVKQVDDPETVVDRALVGALLSVAEGLHNQRYLVQEALITEGGPTDELLLQLDVVTDNIRQGFFQARSLAEGSLLDTIEAIRTGPDTQKVDEVLTDLTTLEDGVTSTTSEAWYELSTKRIEEVSSLIPTVHSRVTRMARDKLESASSGLWTRSILLGGLFIVSILVAVSTVQATRERAEALTEYTQLSDGLREWFTAAAFPAVDNIAVASRYVPASVRTMSGGDWYDLYLLGDQLAVTIGDVAGHGTEATSNMAQLRNVLRGQTVAVSLGPAAQMDLLSTTVAHSEIMATLIYGLLDPRSGKFTYTRAGHIPLLIKGPSGDVRIEEEATGPPVGSPFGLDRTEQITQLEPGSIMILMTDGIVENIDRDIDASLHLIAVAVSKAEQNPEAIVDTLFGLLDDKPFDDAAALVISWDPGAQTP
jgi:Stage II sporulation protein E (SpoIIE)/Nitrate and nitrite sensing